MRQPFHRDNLTEEKRPEKIEKEEHSIRACMRCQSISREKRWVKDRELFEKAKSEERLELTLCPGCQKLKSHKIDGVVELSGRFLREHLREALNLIRHVEEEGWEKNPTARISEMAEENGTITVQTTNQWLAEGIGKAFHKAFKGDLIIQWLSGSDFVRVYWRRD